MIKITLENFQSYKEPQSFIFDKGLTAITGTNNSGKSAVFRAVECLLLNPLGAKSYIHHGQTFARVSLTIPDLISIDYFRYEDRVKYVINNQEYNAIKRNNLFDLVQNFPLKMDERGQVLSLIDEWTTMFPFDRKDSELFKMFEDIFNIQDSNLVVKHFNTQERELKNSIKLLDLSINQHKDIINKRSRIDFKQSFTRGHYFISSLESKSLILNSYNGTKQKLDGLKIVTPEVIQKLDFAFTNNLSFLYLALNRLKTLKVCAKSINKKLVALQVETISKRLASLYNYSNLTIPEKTISKKDFNLESNLAILYDKLNKIRLADKFTAQISSKLSDLNKRKLEIETSLKSVKVCPVCNSNLSNGL